MKEYKALQSDKIPAAIGPYSAGIKTEQFVFTSGQLPIDPATGALIEGSIAEMTVQSLRNVVAILEAAGSDLSKVVKTTIFLADLNDFAEVNAAYAAFFGKIAPARSCVQVAKLPKDARIEIEAIALC